MHAFSELLPNFDYFIIQIASASLDGSVHVINMPQGNVVCNVRHGVAVQGCDWSPLVSGLLATGAADGTVRIFEVHGSHVRI